MKWERVKDPDDPQRCQNNLQGRAQCNNKASEGSKFCPAHGGHRARMTKEKDSMRNYRLNTFKQRVSEFSDSDHINSLRDEVGLLRLLIEEKINRCEDTGELLLVSGPLSDLIMKCASLVEKCHKLEFKLGELLDKSKVVQIAQTIVEVISRHIDDEDILEKISEEISTELQGI